MKNCFLCYRISTDTRDYSGLDKQHFILKDFLIRSNRVLRKYYSYPTPYNEYKYYLSLLKEEKKVLLKSKQINRLIINVKYKV